MQSKEAPGTALGDIGLELTLGLRYSLGLGSVVCVRLGQVTVMDNCQLAETVYYSRDLGLASRCVSV